MLIGYWKEKDFEKEDEKSMLKYSKDGETFFNYRLFDRFYTADQSRTGKSTGLGLSIVKSFMEKMNGTITGQLNDGNLSITCEWKAAKSLNM